MTTGREQLERLIARFDRGLLTSIEFEQQVNSHVAEFPAEQDLALAVLSSHPNRDVREAGRALRASLRYRELSCNFDLVRQTSPLQPGVHLALFGGYDFHATRGAPRWLDGLERRSAVFIAFLQPAPTGAPVALVELDEPIDMPPHRGRFALLRGGSGHGAMAWRDEGVVTVHIVEAPPDDLAAFYAADPFPWHKAIETHAEYRVVPPLAAVAKEVAAIQNELLALTDAAEVEYAVRRLRRLIAEAPAFREAVIPSLIDKLPTMNGAAAAAVRKLLPDLGPPALRALCTRLADRELSSYRRGRLALAVGGCGSDAQAATPLLEELLIGDHEQRVPAAIAMWRISGRAAPWAPLILEALGRPYGDADDAIDALRAMGPDAAEVVPALLELLKDETHPSRRAGAAETLGALGLAAAPALEALFAAARDAHQEVRSSALGALRELRALARLGELILMTFDRAAYPPAPSDAEPLARADHPAGASVGQDLNDDGRVG